MKYKGYEAATVFDDEAGIFHGEVVNTRDVITFQGTSVDELRKAFEESVDDYLEFCKERGEEPEKPFSGNLIIRINPALHRELSIEARKVGKSLNSLIEQKLSKTLNNSSSASRKRA